MVWDLVDYQYKDMVEYVLHRGCEILEEALEL